MVFVKSRGGVLVGVCHRLTELSIFLSDTHTQKVSWSCVRSSAAPHPLPSSLSAPTERKNASRSAHVAHKPPPNKKEKKIRRRCVCVWAEVVLLRRRQECPRAADWLTDWLTGFAGWIAVYVCACVFKCVVRIRRAPFSQEPPWAHWAQSAAPGPVINAASGVSEKQADEKASHRCSIQLKEFPFRPPLPWRKGALCAPVGSRALLLCDGPSVRGFCPGELRDIDSQRPVSDLILSPNLLSY